MTDLLFMKKENRDKTYNELSQNPNKRYKKFITKNQLINPAYTEDYEKEIDRETSTGFGARKERFDKLYGIREVESWSEPITEKLLGR